MINSHIVKHPAVPTRRGRDGATCYTGVALATQVESLLASAEPPAKPGRNPAKPRTPFLPVAAPSAEVILATEAESHRASWRRRVK